MRSRVPVILVLASALLLPAVAVGQTPTITPTPADQDGPALIISTVRLGVGRLLRIPLDGRNVPEVIAEIEDPAVQGWPSGWSMSPDGRHALVLPELPDVGVPTLVDLATGTQRRLGRSARVTATDQPVPWSADATRVVVGDRILDVETGRTIRIPGRDWDVRGFDATGRVVLSQTERGPDDLDRWSFARWDPATPGIAPVPIPLEQAGVVDGIPDAVSAPLGVVVERRQPLDGRSGLGTRSLVDDAFQRLDGVPAGYGDAVVDPTGRLAVVRDQRDTVWIAPLEGSATRLLRLDEDDGYLDLSLVRWTPDSGLLAFETGWNRGVVTVHEVATGRTIHVPLPFDVANARLVRITGSGHLPLLPVARRPAPTPPPETTRGRVVPGSPLVVSERIDRPVGARARYSVALGRPASGGVVRTLARREFVIPLGADRKPSETGLVAGPGPDTITVWTGWGRQRRMWTWRLGDRPRPLRLPADFGRAIDLAWSPRGDTLAAELRGGGDTLRLWARSTGEQRRLAVPRPYHGGGMSHWSADGRAIVIAPWICSDTCDPPAPNAFLVLPIDGSEGSRSRPDRWYAAGYEGRRVTLWRHWRRPGELTVTIPRGLTVAHSVAMAALTESGSLWVLATGASERVLLRYRRPWDRIGSPDRMKLPLDVSWIESHDSAWLGVRGEDTIGCPARDGLVGPALRGVHWVGSCRRIALVLSAPEP